MNEWMYELNDRTPSRWRSPIGRAQRVVFHLFSSCRSCVRPREREINSVEKKTKDEKRRYNRHIPYTFRFLENERTKNQKYFKFRHDCRSFSFYFSAAMGSWNLYRQHIVQFNSMILFLYSFCSLVERCESFEILFYMPSVVRINYIELVQGRQYGTAHSRNFCLALTIGIATQRNCFVVRCDVPIVIVPL